MSKPSTKTIQGNHLPIAGLLVVISLFTLNCNNPKVNNQDSVQIENNFIRKLRKDSLITSYAGVLRQIDLGIATKKFNLLHYNEEIVERGRKDCHTAEEVIALYEKAGITHAKEYFTLNSRRAKIIVLLQEEYPKLYKLPRNERKEIFEAAVPKISVQPELDSIVTHHALPAE
jgi:hypothetical protein